MSMTIRSVCSPGIPGQKPTWSDELKCIARNAIRSGTAKPVSWSLHQDLEQMFKFASPSAWKASLAKNQWVMAARPEMNAPLYVYVRVPSEALGAQWKACGQAPWLAAEAIRGGDWVTWGG